MFADEATTIIEDAIYEKKLNLYEIKKIIFSNFDNDKLPHPADTELVENCFIQVLIDCARIEFEKNFDDLCNNKEFINNFTRHSDEISTIDGLINLCKSGTYIKQLEEHSYLVDEHDLVSFITNIKAYAWKKILEKSKSGHAELEILQCLIVCFQTNTIPHYAHEKLEKFKNNCESQAYSGYYLKKIMNDIVIDTNLTKPFRKFLQSIKALKSNHLLLEGQLLQLIRFYLKPVELTVKNTGNRSFIEILGGIIHVSKELPKIDKVLSNKTEKNQIDEIRFIAIHTLEIDCDLENSNWHGFNIFIMAGNVNVSKISKWNLSGSSSEPYKIKAGIGNSNDRNGEDGIDGRAGESSGNLMILADHIQNIEWLTILLNGGNGANGQDGGDGANGKDGEGISMNELKTQFPSPVHFWGRFYNLHSVYKKICSIGEPHPNWSKGINCYAKLKLVNGQEITHSASRYVAGNCYLLYKGSEGQAGGFGGLNGLGGEGGYQGECIAMSKDNKLFPIDVKSTKGLDGQNGKPGRTGEYGKNGWDVGYVDFQGWTTAEDFGADQKQRLRLDYSTDSSNRVYCGYQYDKLGSSMCYATIKGSTLTHRKMTDNEKVRQTSTRRQRRQQAVATRKTPIQRSAMEQLYNQHFEKSEHLLNGILQLNAEFTMNLDMMRQKAKAAFEEVDKLKERSREKVSRYQIYEADKKVKKKIKETGKETCTNPQQAKSEIILKINANPLVDNHWTELLKEEFLEDELKNVEEKFHIYQTNRQIETADIQRIRQKFGLAKFHNINRNDDAFTDIQEINQYAVFHNEKYLKICEESYSNLEQILKYQDINNGNERIQHAFDDLLKYKISTDDFDIIKTCYDDLASIKIDNNSLNEFLQHMDMSDDKEFNKALKKLFQLKFDSTEWKKLLGIINLFRINIKESTQLKQLIPIYENEVPSEEEELIKYLFTIYNQLCSVKTANNILANLIELLIIELKESTNECSRIEKCLTLYKTFQKKKQKSIENIYRTVQYLSHRSQKVNWLKYHEYPDLPLHHQTEEEMDVDMKLLERLYHIYLKKQNETIDWHKQIDNEILNICLNKMKLHKSKLYAPLLELIGWKHHLNIKVYEEPNSRQYVCVREYYTFGKQVEHILFREDENVKHLIPNEEFIRLHIKRNDTITKFQLEQKDKRYFPFDNIEYADGDDIIIYKLCQFFHEDIQDELENHLKKISTQFIGKNSILSSLLYCFICNGCHLDIKEIFILINTILESLINFDQNPELFSYIIISYSQFHLIDELILIRLENLLRNNLQQKTRLRDYLKNIKNLSIKRLLATKLQESELNITEELFSGILTSLRYITDDNSFLEQLNLSEWFFALKKSYWQHGLTQGKLNFNQDGLEQCSFYLVKLENSYGRELVENLVIALNDTKLFSIETLITFVHRFYADDTELCSDILNDFGILNSTLSNLLEQSNMKYTGEQLFQLCQKNNNIKKTDLSYIKRLMINLGLLTSEDRQIEALVEIIKNTPQHNEIMKHLSRIEDILKKVEKNENSVLQYAVNIFNEQCASQDSDDFRPPKLIYDTCCNTETNFKKIIDIIRSKSHIMKDIENFYFCMLDIVNRGIKLKRGFSLRDTQKIVVLLTLMNEKNLLTQVSTGEGKTLVIATLCIIKCLCGEKLDIVTSCSVLAKRDVESEPPKGNIDLYTLFGVRIGHICSEDIDQRIQVFNNSDVIYGDLSSFQRDYLLDRFYGKNILGARMFENVIVDEVDSMLLDNGNNMLYLSHDIPNMDKLQSLYVFLWQSVNRPINSIEDLKSMYDNSVIRQSVIADLYGMVMRDEVEDNVWKVLIESKTIDQDGRLLKYLKNYTEFVKKFQFPQQKTENRLIFLLNSIVIRQRNIKIPEDLYEFVEQHLDKFIDNAKQALFMSEGVDYVLDVDRTGLDPDLNPKIIIIDKNTGTDQSSSQWHEALHQFLQIKHGCKLSLMSLKAVFISNVSYLKLYKNLYGLSGTLGSTQEKELLNELYSVGLVKIPTSKPKNFFEERSIIAGYKEQWIENIYHETIKKLTNRRSVLIIGETVKDIDYIAKHLIKLATEAQERDSNKKTYENLKNPYIYKREHEEFIFGQGNAFLSCSKVIIATNLAGRGTDIKLEQELIEAGGLHVILTFLPANCRVEEQAYGRAARCGEKGSGQLIVIGNEEDGGSYSSKIFQLKNLRDVNELQRLKMIKKFYDERIVIEEDCFKQFKEHYEDLRRQIDGRINIKEHYQDLHQQIEISENTNDIRKLLLDSFLDKWAFWLDKNSYLIETQSQDSSKKELLFNNLKNFLKPISLQSDCWLDTPSQYLKLGNYYVKNKNYIKAQSYFKKIIDNHSYYLAEALYYSSAIIIKRENTALLNKNGPEFLKLKTNLLRAKELFEERINNCTNDQAIVESYKKKQTKILIHIEAFSEQQKTISQIYSVFINSIDDILGHTISYNAFINFELNEILAYDIFNELQNQGILTQMKITKTISDDTLMDIAIEYGISKTILKDLCKQFERNSIITSQAIAEVLSLPNIEEFWIILKEYKILNNEMEYVLINKEKLALIEFPKIHNLVQQRKIEIKLEATEIFQYPISNMEENIFCSIQFYQDLEKLDKIYLENRGICSINRKANINIKEIEKERIFRKFDSITLSDFNNINISSDDGIMILEKLSDKHVAVLKEGNNGKYQLINNIDCSCLPLCYQEATSALLNSKFAYCLAYKHFQNYFEQKQDHTKFQFQLISNPYQRLIFDLIERSIIQDIQVNGDKLKSIDLKTIFSNFKQSYAKKSENLNKKDNLEYVRKNLHQLRCGIENLETPDCFFSNLENTLKAQQNPSIVEASWFSLNGMEDLISLQEQAYSWRFWRNVAIVTGMAIAQITAGAVIEIFTVGIGTYAASFFINEGISDLFFVAGGLWSGHMTMASYWQHKKWSMAISAVTCGVGALWSRGTKLSRIGYKVAGPIRAEGGKKVAEMTGRKLVESVGMGTVVKETGKRIGFKIIEGAAYGLAQGAVDHIIINYLHGLCDALQKTITADVDDLFRTHDLNDTIFTAFDTIGEKQTCLLTDQITRECFEKTSLYATIYAHCTRLFSSISRGISEAMRKMAKTGNNISASKLTFVLGHLQSLLKVYSVYDEISKIKQAAATFLANANKIIHDTLDEQTSSTKLTNTNISSQRNVQIIRDQTMQQWKQTVIETSNQVIASHVVAPILSYGVNQLVGYVGNSIKKGYRSYKEDQYQQQFASLKKNFDEQINNDKLTAEERQKELKTYHEALIKLLGKTKDAKLFASILRENIPMDMTCVQACTVVMDQCMCRLKPTDEEKQFTGIRIIIESTDGSSYEYTSSGDPSHTVTLTLDNNHFRVNEDGNTETTQNNCLYESLIDQIPQLKDMFSNGTSFREYLSDYIENDEVLQYTISQGWHRFAIKKGSYGGAIREEKYTRQSRYDDYLIITNEAFEKIYRDNPHLSEEIRDKIRKCINDIDEIARDGIQDDNTINKINDIVENFNRQLKKQLNNGNEPELREKLKQRISTFREQVKQTLHANYQATLQQFLEQAQCAEPLPPSPKAVHVADRMNFSRDDIDAKNLTTESIKIRNDPNVIASFIHGYLNSTLPADERRYNTVAVGIHRETIYVAFNHVGIEPNGEKTFGINRDQCEQIGQLLHSKSLLAGRYRIMFLEAKTPPKNATECRAPHGEMQIMRFWKSAGILQEKTMSTQYRPWSIGASKPPCLCCSAAMRNSNVPHKVYGKANIRPTNWLRFADIKVQTKMVWDARRKAPR